MSNNRHEMTDREVEYLARVLDNPTMQKAILFVLSDMIALDPQDEDIESSAIAHNKLQGAKKAIALLKGLAKQAKPKTATPLNRLKNIKVD